MEERRLLTPSWRYLPLKPVFAMEIAEFCGSGDEMSEEVQTLQVDISTGTPSLQTPITAPEQAPSEVLFEGVI